jgi:hypothetical protein
LNDNQVPRVAQPSPLTLHAPEPTSDVKHKVVTTMLGDRSPDWDLEFRSGEY